MAVSYWVPGGTGNINSTTNWSATSGGAPGAPAPGPSDAAIWDANSGTGTVTVNAALSVLSANFTGFGGTLAGSQNITLNGGNLTFGSGMTQNWSGNLLIAATGTTITSNAKEISGALILTTGAPNPTTTTFSGDFKCGSLQHTTVAGTWNLNGSDIYLKGSATTFGVSGSRFIAGTSTIRLVTTTMALSIFITGSISNNVIINATNAITQTAAVVITGGTWTYVSGTWATGVNQFQAIGNCTLNLAGMPIYILALVTNGVVVTLTSLLTVTNKVSQGVTGTVTFDGTHGFTTPTLETVASGNARNIIFKSGVEYFITSAVEAQAGVYTARSLFSATSAGTKAKLTLSQGVTQNIPNVDFTDIDAGNGITICSYNGTISNCTNVRQLNHYQPTLVS